MTRSPDFLAYLDAVERECDNLSRTVRSGELNTQASAHKVRHLGSALAPEAARTTGRSNIREAVRCLAAAERPPGDRVADLVISVNRELTCGISTSPGAFRDFDSERYPYLPARFVPGFFDEFAAFLAGASGRKDPSAGESAGIAARVHWDVNVHGHVFADGCGRTATVVAAWAYWLGQGVIPRLPPREEYLSRARSGIRTEFIKSLAARISA